MNKRSVSLLLLIILLDLSNVKSGEYLALDNGNKYYIESSSMNWYEAIELCAEHNMSLITPDTEERQKDVTQIYEKLKFQKYVWTSGQEVSELKFVWTTNGKNINYSNWKQGEPILDGPKTQCLEIAPDKTNFWLSYSCLRGISAICQENEIVKEIQRTCMKEKQEISTNKTLSIKLSEIEKQLELDAVKNVYSKQVDELTKELKSLRENSKKVSCENVRDNKIYNLFFTMNGKNP